jgi:hypothetical protein
MFSGCKDSQTSADVSNVAAFELPVGSSPGGAGGACTCALVKVLSEHENLTWIGVLEKMRQVMQQKGYTQIPQLSASEEMDVMCPMSIIQPGYGAKKALLIGINYIGQTGELHGCCHDVTMMRTLLCNTGYDDVRILAEDRSISSVYPDARNIMDSIRWLISGAKAGDSLFFHYSGHGAEIPDPNDASGMDQTIIPVDYKTNGQITDKVLFKTLVAPLPQGCQLTAVMDCCHSGTVLDLPYVFSGDAHSIQQVHSGAVSSNMVANPNFDLAHALQVAGELMRAYKDGGVGAVVHAGLGHLAHHRPGL